MSANRSTAARDLAVQLTAETSVPVHARWDFSGRLGWRWHLHWSDGPTVQEMKARTYRLLSGSALSADHLVLLRIVQPPTFALAMIVNVRLGVDPYGSAKMTKWEFENRMLDTSYPERIGTDQDRALAAVLSSMAEHSQLEMAVLLRRIGLTGLDLPPNVTLLSSRHRR